MKIEEDRASERVEVFVEKKKKKPPRYPHTHTQRQAKCEKP